MSAIQIAQTGPRYLPPSLGNFLFSFQGRISRYQYWVQFVVPYAVLAFVAMAIDLLTGMYDATTGVGLFSTLFSY